MPKGRAAVGETTGPVTVLGIADTVPPVAPEAARTTSKKRIRSRTSTSTLPTSVSMRPKRPSSRPSRVTRTSTSSSSNCSRSTMRRGTMRRSSSTPACCNPRCMERVRSGTVRWRCGRPCLPNARCSHRPPAASPSFATAPPREFIDISSTTAETQAPSPAVGREKSLPAATAGGRTTLEVLDFDLTGVGTSSTPDRERGVDVSTGNELEWDGSGLVVDTARATQGGGGAPTDLDASGVT